MPSRQSKSAHFRFLLDEHYPEWLAQDLRDKGIDAVSIVQGRPELIGADDMLVLQAASQEGRIVITEDVSTFGEATAAVEDHVGVIYCLSGRFPRTRQGLKVLESSLLVLIEDPPEGLGQLPVIWWLERT